MKNRLIFFGIPIFAADLSLFMGISLTSKLSSQLVDFLLVFIALLFAVCVFAYEKSERLKEKNIEGEHVEKNAESPRVKLIAVLFGNVLLKVCHAVLASVALACVFLSATYWVGEIIPISMAGYSWELDVGAHIITPMAVAIVCHLLLIVFILARRVHALFTRSQAPA